MNINKFLVMKDDNRSLWDVTTQNSPSLNKADHNPTLIIVLFSTEILNSPWYLFSLCDMCDLFCDYMYTCNITFH